MKKQARAPVLNIFTLILVLCSLTFLTACKEEKAPDITEGRPTMRILFVGNDFTFMNNMPYIVQAFAQSDPSAHFKIELTMHVLQNASLSQLWNHNTTKDTLTSQKWDYVIIQPHHMWAASEGSVYLTQKALSAWSSQVSALGAIPVFFQTWPLATSHSSYGDPKYIHLKNYKNMHRLTRGYTKALTDKYGMVVVPVGDFWVQALIEKPDIQLYNPDRFTPTLAGSYLTALVFYKMLVDNSLDDIGYIPEGMTPEEKAALIALASKKLEN